MAKTKTRKTTTAGRGAKSRKRAETTQEAFRLDNKIPLIQDKTELITPEKAQEMLNRNPKNRPISWRKVKEYQKKMESGEWMLHSQGIIIDEKGNLLTGQKRLLAVVLSGIPQYFRVSRGCPSDTAHLIDRGTPQTSRDLAARKTGRRHAVVENSIARAYCVLHGVVKPDADEISEVLAANDAFLEKVMKNTRGVKKTKAMWMILAVIMDKGADSLLPHIEFLGRILEDTLSPIEIREVWNRGAAFTLGMEKAKEVVESKLIGGKK